MATFEVPIHRALTQQILLGGTPRQFAILNGTLGAALGLGLHSWIGVPICIVLHFAAVALTRSDPDWLDTFKRAMKLKNYYEV